MKIRIKILVPFFMIAVSIFSCSPPSQTEKELRETINKPIHLEMFETLRHTNNLLSFNELRQQYDYLSVVYLQNGCQPCYPKFIEWQQMADSLNYPDNYSVLFVIQGNSYEGFMNEVLNIDYVEDRYYTNMDPEYEFLEANKDIPRWIIDASVLIDAENKIKMVGAPWLNEDMTQLFYEIVNKDHKLSLSSFCEILDVDTMHLVLYELETETA